MLRHIIRFVVSALVLWVISWFVPGFQISGFWTALGAALVIALIGWGIEAIFGANISPYHRGIIGFLVSAVVIYVTQFILAGVRVTILGALLAAVVVGIVDLFVPAKPRLGRTEEGR
ncbi:MAG TPA: phage holin family protein [Bacillota bacterium]|nr:phage holin family protein [Bacillota bacterium]